MTVTRLHPLCRTLVLGAFILLAGGLLSCAKPQQGPPLPPVKIGVAGFTQPQSTNDLLAGFLPQDTPAVDSKVLPHLDELFADVLRTKTKRSFTGVSAYQRCRDIRVPGQTARGTALAHWVAVGKCMEVDFLLVPHIVDFRERDGGQMGVVSPASVTMDVFLVDVQGAQLVSRSRYQETQAALTDNLLDTRRFLARGGRWVTASALAQEGMEKAVKDLGL